MTRYLQQAGAALAAIVLTTSAFAFVVTVPPARSTAAVAAPVLA